MVVGAVSCAICLRVGEAGPAPAKSKGEQLAQMVCSACHIVATKQEWPPILKNVTPSFCEIANRPDTTTRSLARSVTHTHWDEESSPYKMPDPMLNPDQTRAVSQYILTLRGKCDFANARP
jgi:mono/diheme cytochrome c family protein